MPLQIPYRIETATTAVLRKKLRLRFALRLLLSLSVYSVVGRAESDYMSDSDASPPRRRRSDSPSSDVSPPRKRQLQSAVPRDPSGPRKRRKEMSESSDASPPRRPRASPPAPSLRGGLYSAKEIAAEARAARAAETSAADASRAQREAARAAATVEVESERELVEARRRAETISATPVLGGTRNDGELNRRQRSRSRWDDPIHAVASNAVRRGDEGSRSARVAEDELNQAVFTAPPNRFNIAPGPRWDGIDRSNGFESRLVEAKVVAEAKRNARYRADMSGL